MVLFTEMSGGSRGNLGKEPAWEVPVRLARGSVCQLVVVSGLARLLVGTRLLLTVDTGDGGVPLVGCCGHVGAYQRGCEFVRGESNSPSAARTCDYG